MYAVIFRIPNDNFKDLYAKTFDTEDEMYEWLINTTDIEVLNETEVENEHKLEEALIDRLDNTHPLWEVDGTTYWINRF
uniref:Uncharacterized protein n=1 Tax=Podoviridae sp. ct1ev3 TaxID=2825216 RepID=A0A8S5TT36_9CAUD|nr:MAG TPA: hypothetical protein [Podoviridae sp. ct1ev3]